LGYTVDWDGTVKIYVTALMAFAVSYLVVNLFDLVGWVAVVAGGFAYILVYVLGLPLSGALRADDFSVLDMIVGSLGPIAPVARFFLSLLRRLVRG